MENQMDIMSIIMALREAAAKGAIGPDVMKADELDFRFVSANIHLNSLISFAAMCDASVATGELSPEMADLMRRISESVHLITYGLDEDLSRIAALIGYDGWPPIGNFERRLIKSIKNGEPFVVPPRIKNKKH